MVSHNKKAALLHFIHTSNYMFCVDCSKGILKCVSKPWIRWLSVNTLKWNNWQWTILITYFENQRLFCDKKLKVQIRISLGVWQTDKWYAVKVWQSFNCGFFSFHDHIQCQENCHTDFDLSTLPEYEFWQLSRAATYVWLIGLLLNNHYCVVRPFQFTAYSHSACYWLGRRWWASCYKNWNTAAAQEG